MWMAMSSDHAAQRIAALRSEKVVLLDEALRFSLGMA
jgi:hypothetical protein